jgi:hypothetical protein
VERSLGALLIARAGRDDCDELDRLLEGWDGRFSPVLRKRVARHVDQCDTCGERRKAAVSPLALLAAAPLAPAPATLRSRVLDGIDTGAPSPRVRFGRGGFAQAPWPPRRRRAWLVVAAVLAVLGMVGGLVLLTDDEPVSLDTLDAPATTPADPPSETSTSTTGAPSITAQVQPGSTTTVPPVAAPTSPPDGPDAGDGGAVVPPPPPPDITAPNITSVSASAPIVNTVACNGGFPKRTRITVRTNDQSPVTAALVWSGGGFGGPTAMSTSGDVHEAVLGPFDTTGGFVLTYRVVATDAAGNQRTSLERTLEVHPCPS